MLAAAVLGAILGLARQKTILSVRRKRWSQPFLRIAVARSNVEVVDSPIDSLGYNIAGRAGLFVHNHNSTEPDNG